MIIQDDKGKKIELFNSYLTLILSIKKKIFKTRKDP